MPDITVGEDYWNATTGGFPVGASWLILRARGRRVRGWHRVSGFWEEYCRDLGLELVAHVFVYQLPISHGTRHSPGFAIGLPEKDG